MHLSMAHYRKMKLSICFDYHFIKLPIDSESRGKIKKIVPCINVTTQIANVRQMCWMCCCNTNVLLMTWSGRSIQMHLLWMMLWWWMILRMSHQLIRMWLMRLHDWDFHLRLKVNLWWKQWRQHFFYINELNYQNLFKKNLFLNETWKTSEFQFYH